MSSRQESRKTKQVWPGHSKSIFLDWFKNQAEEQEGEGSRRARRTISSVVWGGGGVWRKGVGVEERVVHCHAPFALHLESSRHYEHTVSCHTRKHTHTHSHTYTCTHTSLSLTHTHTTHTHMDRQTHTHTLGHVLCICVRGRVLRDKGCWVF